MHRRDFNRLLLALSGIAVRPAFLRAAAAPSSTANLSAAVDTHAHIFQRGLNVAAARRYVPDYDATLADYLGQLDAHDVAHGVLVQPSFLGTDNSYLVAALRAQPRRLRGVVVVDPAVAGEKLAEFAAAGVVGVRLNLIGVELPDLRQAPWPAFLRRLAALNWFVEVQREARDLPRIVEPLLAVGLNVVIDHFGRPDPKLGVEDPGFRFLLSVGTTRRVWVKLSGAYRNGAEGAGEAHARAAVPLLRAAYGGERLLWGSDWPHTQFERVANYRAVRAQLDEWIPDRAERTAILQTTPAALYHFPQAATDRRG